MRYRFAMIAATAIATWPMMAPAQYTMNHLSNRIERMERDLSILQRQVYREGASVGSGGGAGEGTVAGPRAEVKLSQMEEQIRNLTGRLEELEFMVRSLDTKFSQLEEEFDNRPVGGMQHSLAEMGSSMEGEPEHINTLPTSPAQTTSLPGDGPMELYNHAFGLLNRAQYAEAIAALTSFTEKYPDHALVGNAYYWLGEAYYVQRDYIRAADQFRRGFEASPSGPKAPDNLLKLGMALSALDKQKEACVVFGQLSKKYPNASSAITQKISQEQSRIGCE